MYFEIALLGLVCICMTTLDTPFYTRMIVCARHLVSFYALVGLSTGNLGPACPDIGAWNEVDLSAEDQTFFVEQVEQVEQL